MNIQNCTILKTLKKQSFINQRDLASASGISLGKVNQSIKELQKLHLIDSHLSLTQEGTSLLDQHSPKSAIILAAGYGMRMVPINTETPKGLLEIKGEPIIERQIRFLHDVDIDNIYIVVGFMKERYEYLIDQFHVKFIVNTDFFHKNNLHSLALAATHIENTYIVPCDVWCETNPFDKYELYSWYMVSDLLDEESWVRINRKSELVKIDARSAGNQMIGITYLTGEIASTVRARLSDYDNNPLYNKHFWEMTLFEKGKMLPWAKMCHSPDIVEITTYEQLRELDSHSNQLKTDAIQIIETALNVALDDITDITLLKKGMTNRSFLFTCKTQSYIMRIPGEGTKKLINRKEEYEVYSTIKELFLCDDIIYMNPENGYKITKFWGNARTCNTEDYNDIKQCMNKLRQFHQMELKVNHTFDIFGQIEFYESLWHGEKSYFKDYEETKFNVFQLKNYIDKQDKHWVLTHIDAVPDNFLFIPTEQGEDIRIIDWEYSGMQDSCVDIAMFAIYAMFNREQVENLIDAYYTEGCDQSVRIKIYCYIASCGLLWSNWCEYKRHLGIEFGEYSLQQYRYAKEYYKIFLEEYQNE